MDSSTIKEATDDFKLLGYTVIASVDKKLEVTRTDLQTVTTPLGFAHCSPPQVEPNTFVKRAITAWLRELAKNGTGAGILDEEEEGRKARPLVRQIKTPNKRVIILALVKENINLEELGLEYLTNLRVFYVRADPTKEEKEEPILTLTLTASGATNPATYIPNTREADHLAGLKTHVDYYAQVYKSGEISRMVTDIIEGMNATNMRSGGGVYFVPYSQRDRLIRLKTLLEESLPTIANTSGGTLLHIPIVDEENSKQQIAGSAHSAFVQKVTAQKEALQRYITHNRKRGIRVESLQAKMDEYESLRAELDLYYQLLGLRREELETELQTLEQQAQELISLYATGLAKTQSAPAETGEEEEPEEATI